MADVVAESRREFVRVARSFWLIPEIIDRAHLDDIAILYCFCRRLDDEVDDAPDASAARDALLRFRAEVARRVQPRPLVAAFLSSAERNRLPLECVRSLFDGMESDLGNVRVHDDDELILYCYRVSSSVGLLLAPLLGVHGGAAEARVVDLGIALQLTNVILGAGEDERRGRVYVPASRGTDRARALRGLALLADRYYESAAAGVIFVPLRYRHGVLLLARAYRSLGVRAARGDSPLRVPGQLPFRMRALHLAGLFAASLRPVVLGLLPPPPHDEALHRGLAGLRGASRPEADRRADATTLA